VIFSRKQHANAHEHPRTAAFAFVDGWGHNRSMVSQVAKQVNCRIGSRAFGENWPRVQGGAPSRVTPRPLLGHNCRACVRSIDVALVSQGRTPCMRRAALLESERDCGRANGAERLHRTKTQ
jgi:hypothetical protein